MFMKLKSLADYKNMTKQRKAMFKKNKKTTEHTKPHNLFQPDADFYFKVKSSPHFFPSSKHSKTLTKAHSKLFQATAKRQLFTKLFF